MVVITKCSIIVNVKMEVADKAVSTEDLCTKPLNSTCLEVARLEAVLNTLVNSKVEAIKNETRHLSIPSSPKALINRLRLTSSSTVSSKEDNSNSISKNSIDKFKYTKRKRRENRDQSTKGIQAFSFNLLPFDK